MDKTIDESLDRIDSLSPAPQVLPRLLVALSKADSDLTEVVELLALDPAFTSKLLQICNSALFGISTPVNDVHEAIQRLGFVAVYQVIASVSAAQFLRPVSPVALDAADLWRHSVTVAFAAQSLAENTDTESGLMFTAGLLHDVGKVILDEVYKSAYAGVVAGGTVFGRPLAERERAHFGIDHAEVGARLLERWKFSPQMVASVRSHHHPSAAGEAALFAANVDLADILAHSVHSGQPEQAFSRLQPQASLEISGFKLADLSDLHERIRDNLHFIDAMCQIPA